MNGEEQNNNEDPYTRLYDKHKYYQMSMKVKEQEKIEKETSECTFAPSRPTKSKDGRFALVRERSADPFENLYRDRLVKQQHIGQL